jgi:AAA+ ATPase superfamily predicted ATPase
MTTAAIRQQLHQFIDIADEQNIKDIFNYIENSKEHKYTCSDEELNMLHERAEKYLKGGGETFTVEEAHNYIRSSRKKL